MSSVEFFYFSFWYLFFSIKSQKNKNKLINFLTNLFFNYYKKKCYIQVVEVWSRGILGRIQMTLGYVKTTRASKLQMQQTTAASQAEKQSWEIIMEESSVYALQGRRPKMEDRWVFNFNCESFLIKFGLHNNAELAINRMAQSLCRWHRFVLTFNLITKFFSLFLICPWTFTNWL